MYSIINCLFRCKNNRIDHDHNNIIKQDVGSVVEIMNNDNYLIQNDLLCVICLTELSLKSKKILNCKHTYHDECIKRWFNYKQSCPTCCAKNI
mgnify:FL=1